MKTPKQDKTRKHRSPPADAPTVLAHYKAYAVARDGSRRLLDARRIIVDIGDGVFELDLEVVRPALRRKLPVRANGVLIIGPADASSICIGIEKFGDRKPSRTMQRT